MRRLIIALAVLGLLAALALFVTRPRDVSANAFASLTPDVENGAQVYAAAGCASCHLPPDVPEGPLAGGQAFETDFGTFYAPNISMDPEHGIGDWTDLQLASAIVQGTSPEGAHYYPAFPYVAYRNADLQDVTDLIAHLRTLPASDTPSRNHDVGFPYSIRAALGGWKLVFGQPGWVIETQDAEIARGRYLVEALGHCGECHTERAALGGLKTDQWLAGAPLPVGDGRVPNITPAVLDWSAIEIEDYLASGFTPEFDSAGGEMAAVIRNSTSKLTNEDRQAIAAYLKAVPGVE
jgi:mono/diheme cytochrome c family protein